MAESLARAFAEHEPEAAARALEEMPAEEAALFLGSLPAKLVGPLLQAMSPGTAARRLAPLPARQAAGALMELDSRSCAAILRGCNSETRRVLLAELPQRRVQHFRRSLAYTLDTVGAWIDYDVPALAGNHTVGHALKVLRQRNRVSDQMIFVLRGSHLYAGAVPTSALLLHPAETLLSQIMDPQLRPVSDALDVDEVGQTEDWDDCAVLPVTGPDGSLLGGLSRTGLRRALHSVYPQALASQPESLLAHLFGAYLHSAAEMSRLLLGRSPVGGVARAPDERG